MKDHKKYAEKVLKETMKDGTEYHSFRIIFIIIGIIGWILYLLNT